VDVGTTAAIVAITAVVGLALGYMFGKGRGDTRIAGSSASDSGRSAGSDTGRDIAFRTALRRMHAFLETKVDGPLKRGLKGRRSLASSVKQARAAIQDLEIFMSDPSGDSEPEDLAEMVRSTATDFADEWDVSLRIGPPEKPIQVVANAGAFQDALYLILHNAAQFGSAGPVSVEIREEQGWGRVLVRDSGPGFSPDALSRAYDPFYTTTDGGLGVGLSHARQVVEEQGGRIHLRNAEGGGAEVEIALPVSD
jgi:signal transduction histidine kinase